MHYTDMYVNLTRSCILLLFSSLPLYNKGVKGTVSILRNRATQLSLLKSLPSVQIKIDTLLKLKNHRHLNQINQTPRSNNSADTQIRYSTTPPWSPVLVPPR